MRVCVVLLALWATALPARADHADDLVTEGQELGKAGKLREAIAKFRAADSEKPRALNDCLIGLAQARGKELPAAEISFGKCRRRATAADPLPSWVDTEERALQQKLASYGVVTFELDPAITKLRVAAVMGEDPFDPPARLHLPPGTHVVIGEAPGGDLRAIVEVTSGSTRRVRLVREPAPSEPPPPLPVPAPEPKPAPTRSRAPELLVIGGAGALAAGGLLHLFVVRPAYNDLDAAKTGADYDDHIGRYRAARIATVGLYVAGAALVTTGIVLRSRERQVMVGANVGADRAIVTLEWSR